MTLGQERNLSTASSYIANKIEDQVAGIEDVLVVRGGMSADIRTNSGGINVDGFFSTSNFFDVFSFQLLKGNPQLALSEPNGIVLTESTSKKLFATTSSLGKQLSFVCNYPIQGRLIEGVVTGVVEDPPFNSHIQFEALVSLSTLESFEGNDFINDPEDISLSYVYLVINEKSKKKDVDQAINSLMTDFNSGTDRPITHYLQPLSSFVTTETSLMENLPGPSFPRKKIYLMIALTIIVLLTACFNYTNLSLARAIRRSKEISVRKVAGASRFQIFTQFIIEAVIIASIALIVGIGLFMIIRPEFLNIPNPAARGYSMFLLGIEYHHIVYLLLFAIGIGGIAGFLPALFLSKLKTQVAFKQIGRVKVFTGITLRRVLIIFSICYFDRSHHVCFHDS